jgi:hypothetical protein
MSDLDPISFAGVLDAVLPSETAGGLDEEDILDDLDGEKETIPNLEGDDVTELLATLNNASRGVSDRTHDEYRR